MPRHKCSQAWEALVLKAKESTVKRFGFLVCVLSLSLFAADTPAPVAVNKAEFVYPDFTQCYEKNKGSIVYFGNTRAIAVDEKHAIAYSETAPNVPFIKYDYLSNLYLFESAKPLTPMKLKATSELKLGEWLVSMNENTLNVVNASKIGKDVHSFFEFGGQGEANNIVGGLCCEMYGLGVGDKYYISSEALKDFMDGKTASYHDLGARFVEGNESIFVDKIDNNTSKTKLKVGDKITALNGRKVRTLPEFHEAFMLAKTTSKLSATMERNNAWVEENILVMPPKPEPKPKPKKVAPPKVSYFETKGFAFSPQLALNEPKRASVAEHSGLKAGDRLLQINGMKVESKAEAEAYMDKSREKEFNLLFDRNDFQFFVTLKR